MEHNYKTVYLLLLIFTVHMFETQGIFTKMKLYYKNDFRTCDLSGHDHEFNLTDDGGCYMLFDSNVTKKLNACYYIIYDDIDTRKMAIIGHCACEFITSTMGYRVYNKSCSIARLMPNYCIDLSSKINGKVFTTFFNTSEQIRYASIEASS